MSGIHPTAVLGPGVEVGEGVTISPFAVLTGRCTIGDGVWIGPHAAIGTPAQMRDGAHAAFGEDAPGDAGVEIGAGTVVREFVTVHQGTGATTHVGSQSYLMAYAHVPHDAWIGDGCTLSNSAQLGGHTWVGDGANLGLSAVVHQRSVIGEGAMVGMSAVVTRPVPPFAMAVGVPARLIGANRVAMERAGAAPAEVDAWKDQIATGAEPRRDGLPPWLVEALDRFEAACARVQPKHADG